MIVDRRPDKNDVIFQQTRINVVCAFAAIGLLDHHWYKRRCVRSRVVSMSHRERSCARRKPKPGLLFTFTCRLDSGGAVEPFDRFIATQLRLHATERTLLCQASTKSRC